MKVCLRLLPLVLALLVSGCGKEKTPSKTSPDKESEEEPVPEDLGGPIQGEPTVEVWDWDQTLEEVQKHRGKVVVLHIWATWNETFDTAAQASPRERKEKQEMLKKHGFDEFVRLKKLFRDEVVAISLNTDYNYEMKEMKNQSPETLKDDVMAFVEERGANFQHGISSVIDETLLNEQLGTRGTPATFVFGKTGELRHKFYYGSPHEGEPHSYREDVIPEVKQLIEESYTPPAPKPSEKNEPEEESQAANADVPKESNPTAGEDDTAKTDGAKAEEKVSVELADWEELQKRVAKAKGKVVVVDLWSTQCVPCLKEFPNLVQLHNEHQDDVACLSFNLDYYGVGKAEDLKPDVLKVLKKLKATFPNLMSTESDQKVYEKIKLASIPSVYVYDRSGKLEKRFDDESGEFTYKEDILPLVETLIEDKK